MHGDTLGAIQPVGYNKCRYVHVFRHLKTGFRCNIAVPSKHAKWAVYALRKVIRKIRKKPELYFSDGGPEYQGEFAHELMILGIEKGESPPHTPWMNGVAESGVSDAWTMAVKTAESCGMPDNVWPVLFEWVGDCESLFSGAWDLIIQNSELRPDFRPLEAGKWAAFGTLVTFPLLGVKAAKGGKNLTPRTIKGFFAGLSDDAMTPRVGHYIKEKLSVVSVHDATIHHGVNYFQSLERSASKLFEPPRVPARLLFNCNENARNVFSTDVQDQGFMFGITCGECGKVHKLASDELQSLDGPCLEEFECIHVAQECDMSVENVDMPVPMRVAQQTKVITKKEIEVSWNMEFKPGQTWGQAYVAAVEKEMAKYMRFEVYDLVSFEKSEIIVRYPNAQFVRVGLTFVIKFVEMARSMWVLGARLVVYGNRQFDIMGNKVDGREKGECLWTATPSLATVRTFVFCGVLQMYTMSVNDYVAAYLHSKLEGPPVFFILPDDLMSEEAKRMRSPVNRAWRAAYGQVRAGHDYSAFARNVEANLGWRCARLWDADAAVAVRCLDGTAPANTYTPPEL